ncbi:MAG: hypothetical protein ACRERS_01850 [Methylococcales bacterium]
MTKATYCSGVITVFVLALGQALAQNTTDYADPQSPEGFSTWLWIAVSMASVLGLGIFYLMHKRFWAMDYMLPYPLVLLIAWLFVLVPFYVDQNSYGWFGRDCFQDYIVSSDRVVAQGSRPTECVDARENISALGIGYAIRKYQDGFLDSSPLTTGEIEFVYALLIALWTLGLTGLLLYLYRKFRFK